MFQFRAAQHKDEKNTYIRIGKERIEQDRVENSEFLCIPIAPFFKILFHAHKLNLLLIQLLCDDVVFLTSSDWLSFRASKKYLLTKYYFPQSILIILNLRLKS